METLLEARKTRGELLSSKSDATSAIQSDIKRTTAFVKKVKMLTAESASGLVADVGKLNLKRFVSEIVQGIVEAPLKMKDVLPATQVARAVQIRYDGFAAQLMKAVERAFEQVEESLEKDCVVRRRVLLRLATEMVLTGVADSPAFGVKILRKMCRIPVSQTGSSEQVHPISNLALSNLAGVVATLRVAGVDLIGVVPASLEDHRNELLVDTSPVISAETKQRCQKLLEAYRDSLFHRLVMEHQALLKRKKKNKEEMANRGSLSEKSLQIFQEKTLQLEKILEGASGLADVLNCSLPALEAEEEAEPEKMAAISLWDRKALDDGLEQLSPEAWAYGDDDSRAFYRDLPVLANILPAALFGHKPPTTPTQDGGTQTTQPVQQPQSQQPHLRNATSKGTLDNALEQFGRFAPSVNVPPPPPAPVNAPTVSKKQEKIPKTVTQQASPDTTDAMDDFEEFEKSFVVEDDASLTTEEGQNSVMVEEIMTRLQNCLSRSATEKFALDFCHLNSKRSIKRLISELAHAPWSRCELLPYYARIAAILSPLFPQIGKGLSEYLEREFRGLLKRNDPKRLESRLRNVRFIGELVKFGHVKELCMPPEKAFYVWTTCFKDFTGQNIDCVCALFECVGRYLFRTAETHVEVSRFLNVMMRHAKARNLSPAQSSLIENAYFFVIPPKNRRKVREKSRSNEEIFLRYLFFEHLDGGFTRDHFTTLDRRRKRREARAGSNNPALSQDQNSSPAPTNRVAQESSEESEDEKAKRRKRKKSKYAVEAEQVTFVVGILKKLDWSSEGRENSTNMIIRTCLSIAKKKGALTAKACDCIASFSSFKPHVGIELADVLVDRLENGLEKNISSEYQKLVGYARMFAELFNYRLVDSNTLFDVLFLILNHGHALPWPAHQKENPAEEDLNSWDAERMRRPRGPDPGGCVEFDAAKFNPLISYEKDPPFECFRIRLACLILDYASPFLVAEQLSPRLSRYWLHLERYILSKEYVPVEVEFVISDTFEKLKCPISERPRTLNEAQLRVESIERAAKVLSSQIETSQTEDNYNAATFNVEDAPEIVDEETTDDEDEDDEDEDDEDEVSGRGDDHDQQSLYSDGQDGLRGDHDEDDELDEDEDDDDDDDDDLEDEEGDEIGSEEDEEDLDEDDSSSDLDDDDDEEDDDDDEDDEDDDGEEDDDEDLGFHRTAEDEAFELEFAKLLQENLASEKSKATVNKQVNLDKMSVPHHLLSKTEKEIVEDLPRIGLVKRSGSTSQVGSGNSKPNVVQFKLVKKSNRGKLEASSIHVPADSRIARSNEKDKEEKREELRILKQRLVEFETREGTTSSGPGDIVDLYDPHVPAPQRTQHGRGKGARDSFQKSQRGSKGRTAGIQGESESDKNTYDKVFGNE